MSHSNPPDGLTAAESVLFDACSKEIQRFRDRPGKAWLLDMQPSSELPGPSRSKFGGYPYAGSLKSWPECPDCVLPLNFVLQLHQRQFPAMWFPRQRNLFQLFRCPNARCGGIGPHGDRHMLGLFSETKQGERRTLPYPDVDVEESLELSNADELPVFEAIKIGPRQVHDYPLDGEAFWGPSWARFVERYRQYEWFRDEQFNPRVANVEGTKVGGFPSWRQGSPSWPVDCNCGRSKTFIFQLACENGITIGDMGGVYFFVCIRCGVKSLESRWDC